MKIYSWNVYNFNRKMPEVASYIEQLDFDVLCLQEVTPDLLERLKGMPFHLAYHVDAIRTNQRQERYLDYVAILSKQPFAGTGTLQFSDFPLPFYTHLLVRCLNWNFVSGRGAVYADIPAASGTLRVFSVHLTLWGAGNRATEFEAVLAHVEPGAPTVVCGDFNVIEYGPMKILNWLLGAPLREGMPWYPERDLFEERFAAAGFHNPLRGKVTHRFSRSQLDHILLSKGLAASNAFVEPESHGSDHQPVSVTIG